MQNTVFPLGREYFTDDGIFALESERIFSRSWTYVGHTSEFDSAKILVRKVDGQSILVTQGDVGVRGFRNSCRHRGTELCPANELQQSSESKIVCPYHGWTYGLSGELLGAPGMRDVPDFCESDYGLYPVRVEEWDGLIFATLEQDNQVVPAAEEVFADLRRQFTPWQFSQLSLVQSLHYEVAANWKILFQNYSECYHCPLVHPQLQRISSYKSASNIWEEGPILGGPMLLADDCSSMAHGGHACGNIFDTLSSEQRREVHYVTVFPSLFLSPHPDYLMTHRLERVAVDRTRLTCDLFFHRDSLSRDDFDAQPAIDFWDQTNRQDWDVCERTQLGLRNPVFRPSPYSSLESMVAAFDRHYRQAMQGPPPAGQL